MSTCPRCGGDVPENAKFCHMCGENIADIEMNNGDSEPGESKVSPFYASRLVTVAKVFLIIMTSIKLIMMLVCTALFILSILLPVIWLLFALPAIYGALSTAFGTILLVKLFKKAPRKNVIIWTVPAFVFSSFVAGILLLIAPQEDCD